MRFGNSHWRLKFGVRTLLLALTVLSVWLGWNANIVRERRIARKDIEASGATVIESDAPGSWPYHIPIGYSLVMIRPATPLSTVRGMMGDISVSAIIVREQGSMERQVSLAEARFPEAKIIDETPLLKSWREAIERRAAIGRRAESAAR